MFESSFNSNGVRDIALGAAGRRCHGHARVEEKETIADICRSKGFRESQVRASRSRNLSSERGRRDSQFRSWGVIIT